MGDVSGLEVLVSADDGAALYAAAWSLIGIKDPTGALSTDAPGGYQILRFRHTTLQRGPDDIVPIISAGVTGGWNATVAIEADHMRFSEWFNGLAGDGPAVRRPARRGVPDRPATFEERRFVLSVLTGTVHWSARGHTLSLTQPKIGSLTFDADPEA
jgi:hypothetical protein